MLLALDAVKFSCVVPEDRFLVALAEIFAAENVPDLDHAGLSVEALVREVGGEDERLVTGFAHGVAQAVVVAVETDEDSSGFDVAAKVFARHDIDRSSAKTRRGCRPASDAGK